jgi:hypothetical protein
LPNGRKPVNVENNPGSVNKVSSKELFFFGLVLVFIQTCIDGYVLMLLWKWFVTPCFALAKLTLWQGTGIALLLFSLKPNAFIYLLCDRRAVMPRVLDRVAVGIFILSVGLIISVFSYLFS